MAKTYANGFDGQALVAVGSTSPVTVTGKSQGARPRVWASQFTFAAQAAADQIVIARPDPGEVFMGGQINMSVTTGATATLAVQLNKRDGTTVTLVAALAYAATAVNLNLDFVVTNANLGQVMDGGEIVLLVAAAALPGAGTCKTMLNFMNY